MADLVGTAVFALEGAIAAMLMGIITGVGGGLDHWPALRCPAGGSRSVGGGGVFVVAVALGALWLAIAQS